MHHTTTTIHSSPPYHHHHHSFREREEERRGRTTTPTTPSTQPPHHHHRHTFANPHSQLAESQSISSNPSQLKPHFDKISESISDLEKLVAESSYFLPSYDVRSSLKTVSDLSSKISAPILASNSVIPEPKQPPVSDSVKSSFVARDSPGFRDRTGEVLIQEFKESEVGEFTVSDLDSSSAHFRF